MVPGVAFVEIKTAPEIVPNVNRLADAMRAAGGTVVWIVTTYTDEVAIDWSPYYRPSTPENGRREAVRSSKAQRENIFGKALTFSTVSP
jgi:ureidoacrylate peracid hydrolase